MNLPANVADVSVVIPLYNGGQFFMTCIDSIVNQTMQAREIVVIDDASTDGGDQLCRQLVSKADGFIKYVRLPKHSGASAARNMGINLARGQYIMFVDADDYLLDGIIEHLWSVACASHAEIVQSAACLVTKPVSTTSVNSMGGVV